MDTRCQTTTTSSFISKTHWSGLGQAIYYANLVCHTCAVRVTMAKTSNAETGSDKVEAILRKLETDAGMVPTSVEVRV